MIFGIDIDDTTFCNNVVLNVCSRYAIPTPTTYSLSDLPDRVRHECMTSFSDIGLMCGLQPYYGAVNTIHLLRAHGHTVHFITSRFKSIADATIDMIYKYFPNDIDVHFTNGGKKYSTYVDLKVDVAVDDNYYHIIESIQANCKYSILISNPYTRYNYNYIGNNNVVVVNRLSDILQLGLLT